MKLSLLKPLVPAFLIGFVLAGDGLAQRGGGSSSGWSSARGGSYSGANSHGAPEIHPGIAAAGIVLLVGGTLVLTGRRRAKTA